MSQRVVTVTPAPSIDWTVRVESFELDAVNRTVGSQREAAGKGINVSWALHRAGIDTHAIFPAGGDSGRFMSRSLGAAGVSHEIVDIGREVRTNISLLSPGSSTKINEPGTLLDPAHQQALIDATVAAAGDAAVVLVAGSIPLGTPDEWFAQAVRAVRVTGVPVFVDTSGDPLVVAVDAGADLVKPNVHELAELTRRSIRTFGDVVEAAEMVRDRGVNTVLASLGADGAVLVDGEEPLFAVAESTPFVNTVGAGDALLAGWTAAVVSGQDRADRLRRATLWGASAVAWESTLFPVREDFGPAITVAELSFPDRELSEPSADLI